MAVAAVYGDIKGGKLGVEEAHKLQLNRVRIILSSKKVKNLDKVCANLVKGAKDNQLRVKGPTRIPTKVLHITTRKSPCGGEPFEHAFGPKGKRKRPKLMALDYESLLKKADDS